AVGRYAQQADGEGEAPGQGDGGDGDGHQVVGHEGVGGAAGEIEQQGEYQRIRHQLGEELPVGDGAGILGATPGQGDQRGEGRQQCRKGRPGQLPAAGEGEVEGREGLPAEGNQADQAQGAQVLMGGGVGGDWGHGVIAGQWSILAACRAQGCATAEKPYFATF